MKNQYQLLGYCHDLTGWEEFGAVGWMPRRCAQSSKAHTARSLEDRQPERQWTHAGHLVSEGNSTGQWARGHSCDLLAKTLAALCVLVI